MAANAGDSLSRREFGKAVAVAGVGLALPSPGVFAAGSDTVRVAVVGCGERGTGDAVYLLKSAPGVELVAIADLFQDKVDAALAKLQAGGAGPGQGHARAHLPRVRRLQEGPRPRRRPPGHAADPSGLPARDGRGRRGGGQAPVRREARRGGPGGSAIADRGVRPRRAEGAVPRRGHAAAVRAPVPRARPADPGRPDRGADPPRGAVDRRHGAVALPRPPAGVERHGVAGPLLAALHLALRGPLRRAAGPQPRRGELGRGTRRRSSARASAAGRCGRGRSSATSSTTSRCATSTRTA